MTKVEISFYMPHGFLHSYDIDTEDRGLAARIVLAKYPEHVLRYLNYVKCEYNR